MMSCTKEEDVLLRWRDLVLETDPDIIIGYGRFADGLLCHSVI